MNKNNSFSRFIFLTVDEARELAVKECRTLRISCENGMFYLLTQDLDVERVNVTIENNIVVDAHGG